MLFLRSYRGGGVFPVLLSDAALFVLLPAR
jgi:hypothetical protein